MTIPDLQRIAAIAIKADAKSEAAKARLSKSLREFLLVRGNGAKLAKLTGLSRAFLSDVLNGRRGISAGLVERLERIPK